MITEEVKIKFSKFFSKEFSLSFKKKSWQQLHIKCIKFERKVFKLNNKYNDIHI